jgi:hypothetical protein
MDSGSPKKFLDLAALFETPKIRESMSKHVSLEDADALALTSKRMHSAMGAIEKPPVTGRALVAGHALYTVNAEVENRLYFPTSLSGETANFPHVTRKPELQHIPHLTDVQPADHASMPHGLSPGTYPTRHRYDINNGALLPPVVPQNNKDRGTGTFTSFQGGAPGHFVLPRYKERAERGEVLPALAGPVKLSPQEHGSAPPRPSWTGSPVRFQKKPQ